MRRQIQEAHPALAKALGRVAARAVLLLGLTACGLTPFPTSIPATFGATPSATQTPPIPTPEGPKTLIVCLNQEPTSLYLYGQTNREADTVLAAIYDGPEVLRDYHYQPVILTQVPAIGNGAAIQSVQVSAGEAYLNPMTLQPENLKAGKPYLPSGCTSRDCSQVYQSGEVAMDQMTAEFHLRPGLSWSDGQSLTADDSLFSFNVEASQDTPSTRYLVDRTASYESLDPLTTRWIGIPGFLDPEFATNFWSPLPKHELQSYSPSELLSAEESSRTPIGWGPYVIQQWRAGAEIVLKRNPGYFRGSEGLPAYDVLIYRFVGDDVTAAAQQLLTGECDVLDESVLQEATGTGGLNPASLARLIELEKTGRVQLTWSPGTLVERLDFDLQPLAGPSLFGDARTRLGLAACLDRKALVDQVLLGFGEVTQSYLEPEQPLYDAGLDSAASSVETGVGLLEQAGWVNADGTPGTPRHAHGVAGVEDGTPLAFTLTTSAGGFQPAVAQQLQRDLARCGAVVRTATVGPDELFAPWPDGMAFGRKFEAVAWPWPVLVAPPCEMFAAEEVPSDDKSYGVNASGFQDEAYDLACATLRLAPPASQAYQQAATQTQEILAAQVPVIPLYVRPRLVASVKEVCGLQVDATASTVLWNLAEIHPGPDCGN